MSLRSDLAVEREARRMMRGRILKLENGIDFAISYLGSSKAAAGSGSVAAIDVQWLLDTLSEARSEGE